MVSNSLTTIIVTGVGFGSLGRELIKSFKMAQKKYRIIATDKSDNSVGLFDAEERFVIPAASSEDYLDTLLKICKKENVQALVPGSEPEIEVVSKNKKIFEEIGVEVLVNSWSLINKCSDKFALMKFLEVKGFKCPNYFLYQQNSDIKKIEKYPVVIKPRFGAGSRNVYIAQDDSEATFFADYLQKYGSEPIIQEYLGNHDEEFTIGILHADGGKLRVSIAMKRMLSAALSSRQIIQNPNTNKKYAISSAISQGRFEDFGEIRKSAEQFAEVLESDGPINIQCRKTDDGIIPFEINPRFSATTAARSLVGCNEPDIFCRYRLFDEIPNTVDYQFGYVMRDLREKYISFNDAKNVPRI